MRFREGELMKRTRSFKMSRVAPAIFSILIFSLSVSTDINAKSEFKPGIEELYKLHLIPKFKNSIKVASVSSYDRTGGNDDGFSGKYSFIRKEASGLVLADLKGPGLIYRIHTPTPTDDILEFYFDGESIPLIQIGFRDLFLGNVYPFVKPISGHGVGGYYCYLPIPFNKSCKILLKAKKLRFYQVNYAIYPAGSSIESFQAKSSDEYKSHLEEARKLFSMPGADISSFLIAEGARVQTLRTKKTIEPGQTVTLFHIDKPGRIAGFHLSPADSFVDKHRSLVLKIYWDGDKDPAVNCPVNDFFGYSFGQPATKSLVLGTTENTNYIYFPMPFDESAKIELVSENLDDASYEVAAEVKFSEIERSKDEGKFYAVWRRENPTKRGVPFTFINTKGLGHIVGCILQAQGDEPGSTRFFEGDDQVTIDGQLNIHGTGTEDFFNGGWYDVENRWKERESFPLSGSLGYKKHLARTGGYRFMLTDAFAYTKSILFTIEHSGTGNKLLTDYIAVTYLYSKDKLTADSSLPALEERKVHDPEKIAFTPGYQIPIKAFSRRNATITKRSEQFEGRWVRFMSFRAEGQNNFTNHFIGFTCEMPLPGKYKVCIEAINGPSQSIVQIFDHEIPLGEAIDLYEPERKVTGEIELAVLDLIEGDNHIYFNLIGKNDRSNGLGFDLSKIIFKRIE